MICHNCNQSPVLGGRRRRGGGREDGERGGRREDEQEGSPLHVPPRPSLPLPPGVNQATPVPPATLPSTPGSRLAMATPLLAAPLLATTA
eukprot:2158308-Pyramimonas_sp.AAC.1